MSITFQASSELPRYHRLYRQPTSLSRPGIQPPHVQTGIGCILILYRHLPEWIFNDTRGIVANPKFQKQDMHMFPGPQEMIISLCRHIPPSSSTKIFQQCLRRPYLYIIIQHVVCIETKLCILLLTFFP